MPPVFKIDHKISYWKYFSPYVGIVSDFPESVNVQKGAKARWIFPVPCRFDRHCKGRSPLHGRWRGLLFKSCTGSAGDALIDVQVLLSGVVPAEVGSHALLLQAAPGLLVVVVEAHRLPDDPEHVPGVDVGEGEAPAGALELVVGQDGVLQAAGLPDDGDGTEAHGDHLAQAAGLADGGHEEDVRAGVDHVGQRTGVGDLGGEAAGVLPLGVAEGLLILPVAGAQHHHLHVHLHDLVEHVGDQGEALVAHQAGDTGDDGGGLVLTQAYRLLQGQLAGGLALGGVLGGEVGRQAGLLGRIVEGHVDAVEDALDLAALLVDDRVHAVGIEGHAQLLGIGGRHGGHIGGGHDGALHQVHVPVESQHPLVEVVVVSVILG